MLLAQDRDQLRALMKTVMKFRVHKRRRIYGLDERLLASQEGLSAP
jgi:hypothetical protein